MTKGNDVKIIYHCYGGSHSSVLAANIHVGNLRSDSFPNYRELFKLPYFDRTDNNDFGLIKLVGFDEWGNQVYSLGQMHLGKRFHPIMESLLSITGTQENIAIMGTMPHVNWLMMIGGNLSRKRSLPWLGRPILYCGTWLAYQRLVKVVK
ncbi:MAG: DUF3189 family protein, partial [Methylocystaceae bacterium]